MQKLVTVDTKTLDKWKTQKEYYLKLNYCKTYAGGPYYGILPE